MAFDTPTAWKMDGLELSNDQKLNYLAEHVEALEEAGGGSTVSVTADYTEQTYNNKLATITVDETATKIFAPKVDVTNLLDDGGSLLANVKIGSTTKAIRMPVTVTQGTEIVMPARVLLGFQTALAQINSTTMTEADAYTSTNQEDDIAFADEMIDEIVNGRQIYPVFEMASSNSIIKSQPVMWATVYDQDSNPISYEFWYKTPIYVGSPGAYALYNIYVDLKIWSAEVFPNYSGFQITLFGTMNTFTS